VRSRPEKVARHRSARSGARAENNSSTCKYPTADPDQLLDFIWAPQPAGEDYFLIVIEIPSPTDFVWRDGFCISGDWKSVRGLAIKFLANHPQARQAKGFVYQGEAARWEFLDRLYEEFVYQEERLVQSN
jgi:hypothetical protein